ncbi:hypothetical protein AB0D71_27330 [Streptomyces avermitilis]|uniref:hypothetical protein n=1 Tax=Streptomyces avermitilis TaxID=33903 RepID=UPI0034064F53
MLRGNGGITTGTAPEQAVTRKWLLDAACRMSLAVRGAGPVATLSPEEITAWRTAAPPVGTVVGTSATDRWGSETDRWGSDGVIPILCADGP